MFAKKKANNWEFNYGPVKFEMTIVVSKIYEECLQLSDKDPVANLTFKRAEDLNRCFIKEFTCILGRNIGKEAPNP